jgi:hypothetical protein
MIHFAALIAIILLIGLAASLTSDYVKVRQYRRELERTDHIPDDESEL